jgi:hypothetical protein
VPDLPVGRFGTRNITLSGIQQSLDLGLRLTDWLGVFGFGRAWSPRSETSVSGGAHAAQYINRYLSAQASVSLERGWETREPFRTDLDRRASDDADVLTVQLAAALELDFSSLFAPVSLLGEYMHRFGERTQERRPDTDLGAIPWASACTTSAGPTCSSAWAASRPFRRSRARGVGIEGASELSGDPTLTYGGLRDVVHELTGEALDVLLQLRLRPRRSLVPSTAESHVASAVRRVRAGA